MLHICRKLYLCPELRDDMLFDQPLEGEDKDLILWQVLLHVVNHGTDHRSQLLRLLNDLRVKTTSQDYIFFVYDNLNFSETHADSMLHR